MNQQRQPKGTETGGQFAPSSNPESTLRLTSEAEPLDVSCVVVEEHKDGWTIDNDDYIFTLSRPDKDERRDFWVARFDDQEHEEMEADSDGCAGDTFEDVIGLFDEWPAVKQAMTQAHTNWSMAEPAIKQVTVVEDPHFSDERFDRI